MFTGNLTPQEITAITAGIKAAKTAVINGLYGLLPGVMSITGTLEKIAAQWTTTAQVAWAVACLYGKKSANLDSFTVDLMSIVAGKEMVKDTGMGDFRRR